MNIIIITHTPPHTNTHIDTHSLTHTYTRSLTHTHIHTHTRTHTHTHTYTQAPTRVGIVPRYDYDANYVQLTMNGSLLRSANRCATIIIIAKILGEGQFLDFGES